MAKRVLVLDLECYPNYFLAQFKSLDNRKVQSFELTASTARKTLQANDGEEPSISKWDISRSQILGILKSFTVVTFNGLDYDMPMLFYALRDGVDNGMLKAASDCIIESVPPMRGWQFCDEFGVQIPSWLDHIDLKEPVPGVQVSLKLYGGRLHSKRLQDLPYPPDQELTREQQIHVRDYCENDLDTTIDLYLKARDPKDDIIGTREQLTREYGIDVRSKSDAQCAEAIIRKLVETAKGERIYRQEVRAGTSYRYNAPSFIQFRTPQLQKLLADIRAANFVVGGDGKVKEPAALDTAIRIGGSTYKMGIGGLHSSEKSQGVIGTRNVLIRDRDVVSFYPSLIIRCGLSPESMGEHFQRFYTGFRDQRVTAKKTGNKSLAQTLKIFLNGCFGKLGSRFSVLYAPNLLIQVTVTGQLVLLMMIERMEMAGIPVVSANTDGIVMACPAHLEQTMLRIVAEWEQATGFETEETRYRALFSRDVNNYLALKDGGGVKTKGTLSDPGFMKNPTNMIVNDAVCAYLDKGTPIAETIFKCTDIRRFISVKRVSGGAVKPGGKRLVDDWVEVMPRQWVRQAWIDSGADYYKATVKRKSRPHPVEEFVGEQYLGKVVRWYRSTRSSMPILYGFGTKRGDKVGGSDNAMPVMELPERLPADIDYEFYIAEARDLLREIGATR